VNILVALICITAMILIFIAIKILMGADYSEALMKILNHSYGLEQKYASKVQKANQYKIEVMSAKARKRSKMFGYYERINDSLLNLGWQLYGITVEGVTAGCFLISLGIGIVFLLITKYISPCILIILVSFLTQLVVLYTVSIIKSRKRIAILLETQNNLCASMSNGVIEAVKEVLPSIDNSISPVFRQFIKDVEKNNYSLSDALYRLNMKLGSTYDNFCNEALLFTEHYHPGLEDIFKSIIESNSRISIQNQGTYERFTDMISDYITCNLILVVFYAYFAKMYEQLAIFFGTALGIAILIIMFLFSVLVFIYAEKKFTISRGGVR
jgi:hypothetical protein